MAIWQLIQSCTLHVNSADTQRRYWYATAEVQTTHSVAQQPWMTPILRKHLLSMLQLCSFQPHILPSYPANDLRYFILPLHSLCYLMTATSYLSSTSTWMGSTSANTQLTNHRATKHGTHCAFHAIPYASKIKKICSNTYFFNYPEWPYESMPNFPRPLQPKITCW